VTVFISYLRNNIASANRLSASLAAKGIDSWLDRDEICPGANWKTAIRKAIRNGSYFVACFSAAYQDRTASFMHDEVALAIERLRSGRVHHNWFIPVVFSGSVPDIEIAPGRNVRDIQWVSLTAKRWNEGVDAIRSVVAGTDDIVRDNLVKEYLYEGDGAHKRPLYESVRKGGALWNHLHALREREQIKIFRRLSELWPSLREWEKQFLKTLIVRPFYRPEKMNRFFSSLETAVSITYPDIGHGHTPSTNNISWLVRQCYDQDSDWEQDCMMLLPSHWSKLSITLSHSGAPERRARSFVVWNVRTTRNSRSVEGPRFS
jgi:hypothetical protein